MTAEQHIAEQWLAGYDVGRLTLAGDIIEILTDDHLKKYIRIDEALKMCRAEFREKSEVESL